MKSGISEVLARTPPRSYITASLELPRDVFYPLIFGPVGAGQAHHKNEHKNEHERYVGRRRRTLFALCFRRVPFYFGTGPIISPKSLATHLTKRNGSWSGLSLCLQQKAKAGQTESYLKALLSGAVTFLLLLPVRALNLGKTSASNLKGKSVR